MNCRSREMRCASTTYGRGGLAGLARVGRGLGVLLGSSLLGGSLLRSSLLGSGLLGRLGSGLQWQLARCK